MRNPAEWVIQSELNSFPAYGRRSVPAKTRKTTTMDAHSSDELRRVLPDLPGPTPVGLARCYQCDLARSQTGEVLADMAAPAYSVRGGQVTRRFRPLSASGARRP